MYNTNETDSVDHFPSEDSKLRATSRKIRRGGNYPNSLEVLSQLVKPEDQVILRLISPLPNKKSSDTKTIVSSFGNNSSMDFSQCLYRDGVEEAASSYIISSGSIGTRTIVNHNDLAEIGIHEFSKVIEAYQSSSIASVDDSKIGSGSWWHFEVHLPRLCICGLEA